jgi:hypothetical protein
MELAVVKSYGIISSPLCFVQNQFVVEAKLAFRHATEIGSHENLAINIGT